MVSVCIATYNGEKYLRQQIESILPQLSKEDEIVISDDCSTDRTVEILKVFNDERIKIFVNESNLGVVENFENAIKQSIGEYVFLSDQDDVWEPYKVESIISYFNVNKSIQVVFTDALLIDLSGNSNTIIPNNLWSYHFRKKDKKI